MYKAQLSNRQCIYESNEFSGSCRTGLDSRRWCRTHQAAMISAAVKIVIVEMGHGQTSLRRLPAGAQARCWRRWAVWGQTLFQRSATAGYKKLEGVSSPGGSLERLWVRNSTGRFSHALGTVFSVSSTSATLAVPLQTLPCALLPSSLFSLST